MISLSLAGTLPALATRQKRAALTVRDSIRLECKSEFEMGQPTFAQNTPHTDRYIERK